MEKSKQIVNAAVAVIIDCEQSNEKYLIAKRRKDQNYANYWEFPGGKIEANESPEQAVIREIQEELNIVMTDYTFLCEISHNYPEYLVNLFVYKVTAYKGQVISNEGQEIMWVDKCNIADVSLLLPASIEILKYLTT